MTNEDLKEELKKLKEERLAIEGEDNLKEEIKEEKRKIKEHKNSKNIFHQVGKKLKERYLE